jgi:hypothetical protein
MDLESFKTLLSDAAVASDPRSGGLLDYRDLQQLLGRVAAEASALLEECDAMESRLARNAGRATDVGLAFGPAADRAPAQGWAHD